MRDLLPNSWLRTIYPRFPKRFVRDVFTSVVATGIATVAFSSLRNPLEAPPVQASLPVLSQSGKIIDRLARETGQPETLDPTPRTVVPAALLFSQLMPAPSESDVTQVASEDSRPFENLVLAASESRGPGTSSQAKKHHRESTKTGPAVADAAVHSVPLPPSRPASLELAASTLEASSPQESRLLGIVPRALLPSLASTSDTMAKVASLGDKLLEHLIP
jgi:hypothetical protein